MTKCECRPGSAADERCAKCPAHGSYPAEAYCQCGALCIVYPNDGTKGVCPEHCPDHEYEHERGEGWMCKTCGTNPPADYWDRD